MLEYATSLPGEKGESPFSLGNIPSFSKLVDDHISVLKGDSLGQ